jgi:DNA-directed RNA polymerase specialized sigma subunit
MTVKERLRKNKDLSDEVARLKQEGAETDRLADALGEWLDDFELLCDEIDALPNEKHKTVLNFRYIGRRRWADIARRMNYTEGNVYLLHREALKEFKKYHPEYE